jgi:hypothetical protein
MAVMVDDAALGRVLREAGDPRVLDLLADRLSGADLTTLLLAVSRARAGRLTPPDVLRRYGSDRFTAPAAVPFTRLRRAEDALLSALPDGFEPVTLSPVVPLGTHSVLGGVHQNKVVATIRASEVAADPTNGLALEAAVRRRRALAADPRSATPVRLATVQRVTRAQFVTGPVNFAHFTLFALVTAGRDTGDLAFERAHAVEHVTFLADALRAAGSSSTRVVLTTLDPRFAPVAAAVVRAVADRPAVEVSDDPERQRARDYYTGLCFTVHATLGAHEYEVSDGGFTDWTATLLGNRKERLLISGTGVDRLAIG